MARKPKPWYRKERNAWFVTIKNQRHALGTHPPDAPKPRKGKTGWNPPDTILEAFNKLRSEAIVGSVSGILFDFAVWSFENRRHSTALRYKRFCQDFATKYPMLLVSQLTPAHVSDWLTSRGTWNSTTKRNAITAIQRALNWAVKNKGLRLNPIRGMEKPKAVACKKILSPGDFDAVLTTLNKDDPFRDLLIVSYDSFCRPQEIKAIKARHLQLQHSRAVIAADEAKGEQRTRVIYFPTPRSLAILRKLQKRYPEGLLFRTKRGTPWTASNVKCRFARLTDILGKRLHHYMFRRTGITRAIINGVDSHVVAQLAGHETTAMIDKHYSGIAHDATFMLSQAKKSAK